MIFKLLLFAVVAVALYRLMGGKLPIVDKPKAAQKKREKESEETMVECTHCGTYVAVKEAYIVSGRYYCSKSCLPDKKES